MCFGAVPASFSAILADLLGSGALALALPLGTAGGGIRATVWLGGPGKASCGLLVLSLPSWMANVGGENLEPLASENALSEWCREPLATPDLLKYIGKGEPLAHNRLVDQRGIVRGARTHRFEVFPATFGAKCENYLSHAP